MFLNLFCFSIEVKMAEKKKEETSVAESNLSDDNSEEEIVIISDIFKWSDFKDNPNLKKIVIKCIKCGFNDVCGKFIKEEQNWTKKELEIEENILRLNKEYNDKDGLRAVIRSKGGRVEEEQFRNYFVCPKCDSSLICFDKNFVKNNILNGGLNDEKDTK